MTLSVRSLRSWSLFALAAATLAPLACGGSKPADQPPPTGSASAGWGAAPPTSAAWGTPPPGGAGYGTPPPGNTGYPPPGGALTPPGGTAPAPSASAAGIPGLPGVPIDPNLLQQITAAGAAMMGQGGGAIGDPVELGIKAAAARYAGGMQPEGQISKDNLQAGGRKEMLITLQGGKCYTIIAFSPPGQVTNVDVRLLAPPLYNMLAGQDTSKDNTAVIGAGAQALCPVVPIPVQYKLDVNAAAGQGAVGVQVFSKNK